MRFGYGVGDGRIRSRWLGSRFTLAKIGAAISNDLKEFEVSFSLATVA